MCAWDVSDIARLHVYVYVYVCRCGILLAVLGEYVLLLAPAAI